MRDAISSGVPGTTGNLLSVYQRSGAVAREATRQEARFKAYHGELNEHLRREIDGDFFGHWNVTPTPLVLRASEWGFLERRAALLMRVVDKVIDLYLDGNEELERLFGAYSHLRRYMVKRSESWHGYGRYDFVIDSRGEPVIIELNMAMASGLLPMAYVNHRFAETAPSFLTVAGDRENVGFRDPDRLGSELVRMERSSGAPEGAMAILVDENKKLHEVELLKKSLERAGKAVVVGDVRDLESRDGALYFGAQRISSTYNKFRLFGAVHNWTTRGWADSRTFMNAVGAGQLFSINNFAAMTIGEDKSIFCAMRLPSVQAALDPAEREVVASNTPRTFVLDRGMVNIDGKEVELIEHVSSHRGDFVCKPRSDYRGNGVFSGRDCSEQEWRAKIEALCGTTHVAQHRVDAAMLDVAHVSKKGSFGCAEMRIAGGIYFAGSGFQGLVARAAPWEVVTGIKGAHMLPIDVLAD